MLCWFCVSAACVVALFSRSVKVSLLVSFPLLYQEQQLFFHLTLLFLCSPQQSARPRWTLFPLRPR